MTAEEMRQARATLGEMWGFCRPLHMSELGRALRLSGKDPGQSIRDYERGATISGPVSACIDMWLRGALPPDGIASLRR